MYSTQQQSKHPCIVINVEIRDNHEDAAVGGQHILRLVKMLESSSDLLEDIDAIIQDFREVSKCSVEMGVAFY